MGHEKSTTESVVCQSSHCNDEHEGKIQRVRVCWGRNHVHCMDFHYCEKAIKEDAKRGFDLEILDKTSSAPCECGLDEVTPETCPAHKAHKEAK